MSHIVSLHFENPSEDSSLATKLDAIEGMPIAKGDHVEIVGIWKNEDGSIGIHVEVVEKPLVNDNINRKPVSAENQAEPEALEPNTPQQDAPEQETVERAAHDDITKADMRHGSGDKALEMTPEMQAADDDLEEDFDLAAEGQLSKLELEKKLKAEIEAGYDKQKEIMPEIGDTPDPNA